MTRTLRTFVAAELDDAVRQRAAGLIEELRGQVEGVSWVRPENLHVTLKFLGDVAEDRLPAVLAAVRRAAAAAPAFEFEVRGVGAFPRPQRPNNLWLGGGEGSEALAALAASIEAALKKLGFPKEGKAFQPHVTLGRVRRGEPAATSLAEWIRRRADFVAGRCRIASATVFSSELTPHGAIYTPLDRAPLAAP